MGDLQRQTAAMAQPRVIATDPGVQVEQEPVRALPPRRLRTCVENWPEAETGSYDPRCCRFPKSCSATVYNEGAVADDDLEPVTTPPPHPAQLARVGDVIEHGQPIPGNVARLRDIELDIWVLSASRHWHMVGNVDNCNESCRGSGAPAEDYYPYTVVEVDPEPQPAERLTFSAPLRERDELRAKLADSEISVAAMRAQLDVLFGTLGVEGSVEAVAEIRRLQGHAPNATVVLRLPEVPEGTVALIGNSSGLRWTPYGDEGWQNNGSVDTGEWAEGTFAEVLAIEHPYGVTVEFAPPREPRTWPKIDPAPDDLPQALDLSSHPSGSYPVRWVLDPSHEMSGMYVGPLGNHHTLPELRAVGWVTEVLS